MNNLKENKLKYAIGTLVVMFVMFACGACSALALSSGGDGTVEKEVTRIVYNDVVVVETRLVEVPIEVEVEVTRLVEVAVEVTRLAEPEPTSTPAGMSLSDYVDVVMITMENMSQGMSDISTLMMTGSDTPSIIFERVWSDWLLEAADKLTVGCLTIRELEAPPSMAEHHDYLLLACNELEGASFELSTFALLPSIDSDGIERLVRATEMITLGGEYLGLATQALP